MDALTKQQIIDIVLQTNSIKTERLELVRPVIGKVLEELTDQINDSIPELSPFLPWVPTDKPQKLEDTTSFQEMHQTNLENSILKHVAFVIMLDGKAIGSIGFDAVRVEVPSYNIGYWLSSNYTGKGYMTESVNAITLYLKETLKARRVEITVHVDNAASANTAERSGYALEAIMKNEDSVRGKVCDMKQYVKTYN